MAVYYIKTNERCVGLTNLIRNDTPTGEFQSRTLILEADSFRLNKDSATYEFLKASETAKKASTIVASVPQREVFAVLDEEVYLADYFAGYPEDEDEPEVDLVWDECPGCPECMPPTEEIPLPVPVPETPVAVPDPPTQLFPIEHWVSPYGYSVYGFQTPGGFIGSTGKESALYYQESYANYPNSGWVYTDLNGYTKVED